MKRVIYTIAAALAILLTACSFFNKEEKTEYGTYSCEVTLTGGSGKATVESPAEVVTSESGNTVKLVWSSSNYDYMIVDDIRYDNEAEANTNSVFTIPFDSFNEPFTVIGDTTAMSTPHEIEYELTVFSEGKGTSVQEKKESTVGNKSEAKNEDSSFGDLSFVSSYSLDYAKEYSVDFYVDGDNNEYAAITIGSGDSKQCFLKPIKGAHERPKGVSDDIKYLPDISKTYLVSTSVMDMVCQIDALKSIALSGTKAKDWYISDAKAAMKSGEIIYAGKYSAPDYELLLSSGCNFAIENTMIYHNPEVKEKLEEIGIPVMVERSSYEENPLGRLEWIKLYGILFDKQDVAEAYFNQQVARVDKIGQLKSTGKKVAFFSVNSNGQIIVRKPKDYIATMISMAGGHYVPDDISVTEDNALSTMKITTEDFYIRALEADVLIYNSTIEGEIESLDELIALEQSLGDFKAIKQKNVYCLREGYFQKSTNVAEFIEELNEILEGSFDMGDCFIRLRE